MLGLLCNALVCLAVWLTYGAHTTADKILAVIAPIAAFVALGFEHSVANMYFIPVALLIKTDDSWMDTTTGVPDVERTDVGELPLRQPAAGHDREHHRRGDHGRRRVLVRLPPRSRHERLTRGAFRRPTIRASPQLA